MFIPEFVCGILATIGVEILLLIGYAIVLQFTKDGDFVAEYESCNDAIRAIGKPNAKISEVCSGKRKSTYGFVFKYKEV